MTTGDMHRMSLDGIITSRFWLTISIIPGGFYGGLLELEEKPRPAFRFPGLFYHCGGQELHLIVASRHINRDELFIDIGERDFTTRRYIHRHAAFMVSDTDAIRSRLERAGIEILFSEDSVPAEDELATNMVNGWKKMYDAVPVFVKDPSGNLIELVPWG